MNADIYWIQHVKTGDYYRVEDSTWWGVRSRATALVYARAMEMARALGLGVAIVDRDGRRCWPPPQRETNENKA